MMRNTGLARGWLAGLALLLAPLLCGAAPAGPDVPREALERWPQQGSIVYRVNYGDGGLQIGEAHHAWSQDGTRYEMSLELRTTGAAALLHKLQYVQRSEGSIERKGLRPLRFTVDQRGRASDAVEFDWQAAQANILRGGRKPRTAALAAGDQDVLSLWHQVHLLDAAALPAQLAVLTGKRAKAVKLEQVGTERLRLPLGEVDALRLRAQTEDDSMRIDIWLDRQRAMQPVRIRIVDDDGSVLDQQAITMKLGKDAAPVAAAATEGAR